MNQLSFITTFIILKTWKWTWVQCLLLVLKFYLTGNFTPALIYLRVKFHLIGHIFVKSSLHRLASNGPGSWSNDPVSCLQTDLKMFAAFALLQHMCLVCKYLMYLSLFYKQHIHRWKGRIKKCILVKSYNQILLSQHMHSNGSINIVIIAGY